MAKAPISETPPGRSWAAVAPYLAAAAAGAIVFRGALGLFFSQDDFAGLARARGFLPPLGGPWRYLSGQAYFDAMETLAGLNPLHYHAFNLLAHLACVVLLLALLRRHTAAPAACVAAIFFAVHPSLFTALYSISGVGEILALAFGLAAMLAARVAGPLRWSALPLFGLSLLSKESTLLLPLVVAAERVGGPRSAGLASEPKTATTSYHPLRDPLLIGLAAIALLYVVSFLSADTFGLRGSLPKEAAYSLGWGSSLGRNLLSYVGWTVNFSALTVRSFSDSVDPRVFSYGIVGLLAWLVGSSWKALRDRGWVAAGLLYACFLLPVLPLRNHTYHYYLYAPMAGAAWCLAALLDVFVASRRQPAKARPERGRVKGKATRMQSAVPQRRPARLTWAIAAVVGTLLTVNGAFLVRKIETYPFLRRELRADPTVDRARIARNVSDGLAAAHLPAGARLRFWSPAAIAEARAAGQDPARETYWERNVREALLDGLAVRVLFPQVGAVEFVRTFPAVDKSHLYAVYGIDGRLKVMSPVELDSLIRASPPPR